MIDRIDVTESVRKHFFGTFINISKDIISEFERYFFDDLSTTLFYRIFSEINKKAAYVNRILIISCNPSQSVIRSL